MPVVLHPDSACDICLEPFSESLPPHAIPCGHIFCESCFKNENYRPHLCALCRQPYHPDRTKRLHVEMKYLRRTPPRNEEEGEILDYTADGSPRRTKLPTDLMLLVKLAAALDLRPEVPVKQLRSALKHATKWRDENNNNPSGLALKNLLKFVEEYRYASSRCHQLEDQFAAMQVPDQVVAPPESPDYQNGSRSVIYSDQSPAHQTQPETGDIVKAIWNELSKTRDRVEDLTREMDRMRTISHTQQDTFSPAAMWPMAQGDEFAPAAYPLPSSEVPHVYFTGAATADLRRTRSDEAPQSDLANSPGSVRTSKSASVLTTATAGSGASSPRGTKRAQTVRFQYPPRSSPPPSSDPLPPRASSPRRSHHHERAQLAELLSQTPHHRSVPFDGGSGYYNNTIAPSTVPLRQDENLDAQSVVSSRTAMTWGTVTSANTLHRLPLAQLPMSRNATSVPVGEGRLLL